MNYVDTTKTINHVSLCAGYGGIDIGLKRAIPNLRTIAFSEIEAYACANLVAKMEQGLLDPAPIWTDLKTFPWSEFRGVVDILSGGFPCQPFSAAGKRQGDEDPRHLFPYILDGIRKCQPKLVFLENVEGIISARLTGDGWADPAGTPVLLHVLRELERVGYKATAGVFSASEVGAPHQRKRIFILAHSRSLCAEGSNQNGINGYGICKLSRNTKVWGETIGCSSSWPSRPGQPQYSWEPPRVIGTSLKELVNTNSIGNRTRLGEVSETDGKVSQRNNDAELIQSSQSRWPVRPGQPQYEWEPPRVVGNAESRGTGESGDTDSTGQGLGITWSSADSQPIQSPTESSLGRNSHGPASGMDYAELCQSCDNRTDELRLLGNGVVPQACTKAFITLYEKLQTSESDATHRT
jgi:DNA (cytosine-5)-methyltransferase 1